MSNYTLQSPTLTTDDVSFWALVNPDSTVIPFEYHGWKPEVRAWQDGVYVGTAISDTLFPYTVEGAGAVEFMNKYFTNNFSNCVPVRILRLGMAGTLSYEVQLASYEGCTDVYDALIAAGEGYGLERLGLPLRIQEPRLRGQGGRARPQGQPQALRLP